MPGSANPFWQPLLLPRLESVAPADIAAFLRVRREYEQMAKSVGHPAAALKSSIALHILEYLCAVHIDPWPLSSSSPARLPCSPAVRGDVAPSAGPADAGSWAQNLITPPGSPSEEPITPETVADETLAQCLQALATTKVPAATEMQIYAKLRFPAHGRFVDRVATLFAEFFKIVGESNCPSFIEDDPMRSIAHILRVLRPRYLSESIRFEITHCHKHLQQNFRRFVRYVVRHVATSYNHISEADLCGSPGEAAAEPGSGACGGAPRIQACDQALPGDRRDRLKRRRESRGENAASPRGRDGGRGG